MGQKPGLPSKKKTRAAETPALCVSGMAVHSVVGNLGKVPSMPNDKGAASLASGMTSFSGGRDNAKPHSARTVARLCGRGVWLLNWSVCSLQSRLRPSTLALVREDKINPKLHQSRAGVSFTSLPPQRAFDLCFLFFSSFTEPSFFFFFFFNVRTCLCSRVSALRHVLICWS